MDQEEKNQLLNMVAYWKAEKEVIYKHHEELAFQLINIRSAQEESGKQLVDIDRTLEYLRKKLRLKKPITKPSIEFTLLPNTPQAEIKPNAEQLRIYVAEALAEKHRFLHKREIEDYIKSKYKATVDVSNLSQQLKNLKEAGTTVILKYNNSNKYTFHGYSNWLDESEETPRIKRQYIFDKEYFPQLNAETMEVIRGPD